MRTNTRFAGGLALALGGAWLVWSPGGSSDRWGLERGTPELESIGALTFGPENILLVGDPRGAAIFAIAIDDDMRSATMPVVEGIDRKVAAMLGTEVSEITIHDLAVHPGSRNAYLSVTRGGGNEAAHLLIRVDGSGRLASVPLNDVEFTKKVIDNAPDRDAQVWRRPARTFTVTDLAYVEGEILVAGLSNEEFASNFRRVPFPFNGEMASTSLEIYHVSHGQDETHAPVQTFAPISIDGRRHVVAAYTCTPVVTFDIESLEDGEHVVGTTVAELGASNQPLDIVPYEWEGRTEILVANSRHPLMKIHAADLHGAQRLVKPTKERGVPRSELDAGIIQLADLNDSELVALKRNGEALDLVTLKKAAL